MTIKDVINAAKKHRPGSVMAFEECSDRLGCLEADIHANILSRYKDAPTLTDSEDPDRQLLVPDIYAELYVFYLVAAIDLLNADITRYSNSMILYNSMLSEFADWYNRSHTHLQTGRIGWC